jgi:hypothetical protein
VGFVRVKLQSIKTTTASVLDESQSLGTKHVLKIQETQIIEVHVSEANRWFTVSTPCDDTKTKVNEMRVKVEKLKKHEKESEAKVINKEKIGNGIEQNPKAKVECGRVK